jgi:hypothetical protein
MTFGQSNKTFPAIDLATVCPMTPVSPTSAPILHYAGSNNPHKERKYIERQKL